MSNLPNDIIADILSRLPAKSLVRFRCVSKSWLSLITDPSFIRAHLNRSSTAIINNNPSLLLMYTLCPSLHPQEFLNLDPSFNLSSPQHLKLVGSYNGLLCLSTRISCGASSVFLWNPSINQYTTLPDSHLPDTGLLGFGFDGDDYKVVKIVFIREPGRFSEVEVYSLRSNSWKSIGDAFLPQLYFYQDNQVVINGSVHWSAEHWRENRRTFLIVAFDIANEVFWEIALPDCICAKRKKYVGVLGGCLCVFSHDLYGGYEVWVMKEYGVVESWIKQYVIGSFFVDIGKIRRPLGFTRSGEVLFGTWSHERKHGGLILYDPESKMFKDLGVHMCLCSCHVVTNYVESLVSVVPSNVSIGYLGLFDVVTGMV